MRAYGAKKFFREELNKRIDDYVRASLVFYDLNRWVSVRLDFLGAAAAVAGHLIALSDGLSTSCAIQVLLVHSSLTEEIFGLQASHSFRPDSSNVLSTFLSR